MAMAAAEFEAVKKTKVYEKVVQQIHAMIRDGLLAQCGRQASSGARTG